MRAERDEAATQAALAELTRAAASNEGGMENNLLALAIDAARAKATGGEISDALEKVYGRHQAEIRTISGVYRDEAGKVSNISNAIALVEKFAEEEGRRPRILVAKMGQDGHDRGQKVISTGFADLGFDVDVGPLFQTPEEVAQQAADADVHIAACPPSPQVTSRWCRRCGRRSPRRGRPDIMVVVGGVIPRATSRSCTRPVPRRSSRPARSSRTRRSVCCRSCRSSWDTIRLPPTNRPPLDLAALGDAVLEGRRSDVSKAITLVESTRADHREQAQQLLLRLLPHAGSAIRVGITGVPGVGKSTTIEALGMHLISLGHKVAVLAVDPSSTRTGGSILGDKTRMQNLSVEPNAFIRPSPTSGTLGGVAKATRETMVLLEAAATT